MIDLNTGKKILKSCLGISKREQSDDDKIGVGALTGMWLLYYKLGASISLSAAFEQQDANRQLFASLFALNKSHRLSF